MSHHSRHHDRSGFHWSKSKCIITGICVLISCIYIYSVVSPFIKHESDAKDVGGICFAVFHAYMIISMFKIGSNSSFIFFILTYIMLLSITACFQFYDVLFDGEDEDEEDEDEGDEEEDKDEGDGDKLYFR